MNTTMEELDNNGTLYYAIQSIYNVLKKHVNFGLLKEKCRQVKREKGDELYTNLVQSCFVLFRSLSFETLVHYFHFLKDQGRILGETHAERADKFTKIMKKGEEIDTFFSKYPLLLEVLNKTINDRIKLYSIILDLFIQEEEEIRDTFDIKGAMISIECGVADTHEGKTVSLVTFNDGSKLIFKPRSASLDIAYATIVRFLADDKINMFFPRVIEHNTHSWHFFIENKACETKLQCCQYYYRAGIHLAALFSLGSSDIHYENVIAYGEHPVIVDLETILCGSMTENSKKESNKSINNSVVSTGMLPFCSDEALFDFNISGLFSKTSESKKIKKTQLVESEEDDWFYKKENIVIKPKDNNVTYGGRHLNDKEAEKHLIKGFRMAMCRIKEKAPLFFSIVENAIDNNVKVRQILRPTHVYYRFIDASLHPDFLMNRKAREDLLDLFSNAFEPGEFGYIRLEEELFSMRLGDIPYFYTFPRSVDLYSRGKIICKSFFKKAPLDVAKNRILSISDETINVQERYIKMSVASLKTTANIIRGEYEKNTTRTEQLNNNDIEKILKKHAEYVVEKCVELPDGNKYLNLLVPNGTRLVISPFSYDLYYSLGIVLFLLEYSVCYNNPEIKKAVVCLLQAATEKFYRNLNDDMEIDISLFRGCGGLLYVLYIAMCELGNEIDEDVVNFVANYLLETLIEKPFQKDDIDYISGISGTLYLIQNILNNKNCFSVDNDRLEILERKYIDLLNENWESHDVVGMAHGLSGACLPLGNIAQKNKQYSELINKILIKEDGILNTRDINYSWCRGYSGVYLARNILADKGILEEETAKKLVGLNKQEVFSYDFVTKMLSQKNLGICHGVYGNIDILISLGLGNKFESMIRERRFASLEETRWISGSDYAWLNFMIGTSGVAYVLMRVIQDIPSVLTIDLNRYKTREEAKIKNC